MMEVGINIMHEGHNKTGKMGWELFTLGRRKALKTEIYLCVTTLDHQESQSREEVSLQTTVEISMAGLSSGQVVKAFRRYRERSTL